MGEGMKAWVATDGSYGGGEPLVFDSNKLTDEQWERLTDMADGDKYAYVKFIIEGHDMNVREIEMENFGEEWGL